ncbi:MAG: amino acid permease [Candidatus Diapherotrites archaeon]
MPLRRELTLWEAVFSGVGIIVGAGVYAIIAEATALAGNTVWLSFVCAAIVAATAGLSYAELSSIYPKAGAEYDYIKPAFGQKAAFLVAWLAIFASIVGITTVAMSFGGYLSELVCLKCLANFSAEDAFFNMDWFFGAAILIIFSTLLLLLGVKKSAELAIAITLISILGLIIAIFAGIPKVNTKSLLEIKSVSGIFSGGALVFFAYIGFEEIVRLSEETKDPQKNIPLAVILAILITSILYILVSIATVSIVTPQELASSPNPMAIIGYEIFGNIGHTLLSVIALFATASTVILIMLATSRILYGMSKEGALPAFLSKLSGKGVPYNAVFATSIASLLFLSFGSLKFVANTVNFSILLIFLIVNFSLIHLRLKLPAKERPFKVPLNVGFLPLPTFFGIILTMLLILSIDLSSIVFSLFALFSGIIFLIFYP